MHIFGGVARDSEIEGCVEFGKNGIVLCGSCIELQNYIREPYPSSERWSSAWWKACSPKFPHVAWAARKILCVPATSASVGRFSSCIWHGKLPLKSRKAIERVEKMALLSYNDPKEWHWNQM